MDMGTGCGMSNSLQGGFSGPSLALPIPAEPRGNWPCYSQHGLGASSGSGPLTVNSAYGAGAV